MRFREDEVFHLLAEIQPFQKLKGMPGQPGRVCAEKDVVLGWFRMIFRQCPYQGIRGEGAFHVIFLPMICFSTLPVLPRTKVRCDKLKRWESVEYPDDFEGSPFLVLSKARSKPVCTP